MSDLTAERLRELLHYDPETGSFTWKAHKGAGGRMMKKRAGDPAGCRRSDGRLVIWIDGRLYNAPRLAWLYMMGDLPAHEVDHEDTNPSNDKWANLRLATHAQNLCNQRIRATNRVGLKGVTWVARTKRFRAQIMIAGKNLYLGDYLTADDAHASYCRASKEHHGQFGRVA